MRCKPSYTKKANFIMLFKDEDDFVLIYNIIEFGIDLISQWNLMN